MEINMKYVTYILYNKETLLIIFFSFEFEYLFFQKYF